MSLKIDETTGRVLCRDRANDDVWLATSLIVARPRDRKSVDMTRLQYVHQIDFNPNGTSNPSMLTEDVQRLEYEGDLPDANAGKILYKILRPRELVFDIDLFPTIEVLSYAASFIDDLIKVYEYTPQQEPLPFYVDTMIITSRSKHIINVSHAIMVIQTILMKLRRFKIRVLMLEFDQTFLAHSDISQLHRVIFSYLQNVDFLKVSPLNASDKDEQFARTVVANLTPDYLMSNCPRYIHRSYEITITKPKLQRQYLARVYNSSARFDHCVNLHADSSLDSILRHSIPLGMDFLGLSYVPTKVVENTFSFRCLVLHIDDMSIWGDPPALEVMNYIVHIYRTFGCDYFVLHQKAENVQLHKYDVFNELMHRLKIVSLTQEYETKFVYVGKNGDHEVSNRQWYTKFHGYGSRDVNLPRESSFSELDKLHDLYARRHRNEVVEVKKLGN